MRKLIVLPCFALVAAAAPATSAAPALTNQVAADAQKVGSMAGAKDAQAVPEKKICKLLPSTGSRLPNRACLTAKEWKQLEAELEQ